MSIAEQYQDVYSYIISEEENFRTERVPLASNWRDWNMYEHIDRSFQLKNSKFYKGAQDYTRYFHNIILPIAQVNYRTEGFDFKDVQLYVDNSENYHKSFMARKFHQWWAVENGINTAIDESVESYFDYGLTLLKNVNEARPEVIQLQQIAFCDQTNIMSGPICLKHNYSIPEMLEMKDKWIGAEVDKAVAMARFSKQEEKSFEELTNTPGKYVEVYELHGSFPESWLGVEKMGQEWKDEGKYISQVHIITYYVDSQTNRRKGITLFKGKELKPIFKALKRDEIYGRACGRGGIEELFHPQIWANWSMQQVKDILEASAQMFWVTNDKKFANQKISNMKKGEVKYLEDGKDLVTKQMQASSKIPYDQFTNLLEQNARTIGSATDPQLGLNPVSGTPLGTTEIVTAQGQGVHEYRRGKIADFWAEVYRDWVLPNLSKEITKGAKWLDSISLAELQDIAEKVAVKETNKRVVQMVIDGKFPTQDQIDAFKELAKQSFIEDGDKRFFEIVKDEFKNLAMDMEIDIVGKQKNLFENVSKLNSVFRSVFTPAGIQVLQSSPAAQELLNQILEKSGLSPVTFSAMQAKQMPTQRPAIMSGAMSPQMPELPITA